MLKRAGARAMSPETFIENRKQEISKPAPEYIDLKTQQDAIHRSGIFFKALANFAVGSLTANRHHLQGIFGGVLQTRATISGLMFQHFPDV